MNSELPAIVSNATPPFGCVATQQAPWLPSIDHPHAPAGQGLCCHCGSSASYTPTLCSHCAVLQAKGVEFVLPTDVVVADKFAPDAATQVVDVNAIPDGWMVSRGGRGGRRLCLRCTSLGMS